MLMKKEIISKLKKSFEDYANEADGIEFWLARDLQKLLEYEDWRNFLKVIEKAKKEQLELRGEISRLQSQKERFLIEYRDLLEKHLKCLTEEV